MLLRRKLTNKEIETLMQDLWQRSQPASFYNINCIRPPDSFGYTGDRGIIENFLVSRGFDADWLGNSLDQRNRRGYNYTCGRFVGPNLYNKKLDYRYYDERAGEGQFMNAMQSAGLAHLVSEIQ